MDFKSILNQLSQLNEATKETPTGKIHKAEPGGYGRKFDTDEEGDEKKEKKPEVKRGRGRPKKGSDSETGEVKKFDFSAFGVKHGKDIKLPKYDKSKTTKHSLKEWVEEIEAQYVSEAEQVTMEPAKQNTQVIKQGTKTLGTVTNPQLAAQVKAAIGKGEMSLAGDELGESDEDYSAKKARAGKDIGKPGKMFAKIAKKAGEKYGSKERGEKVAGAILAKLRSKTNEADIPSDQVDMGAGLGAGRNAKTFEGKKPDFLDLDKDGNKKESMKKAASDAKKDKKKVDEGMEHKHKAARHAGKAHALAKEGYNCRYDNMEEMRAYHEGYKEGLDECYGQGVYETAPAATVPGMASQATPAMEAEVEEGNAFTAALAKTPKGGKFSVGGKTFTDRSDYSAKVDEMTFEGWDNQLNSLLEGKEEVIDEGMTVSISKGQQGSPDSVSVSAQDAEAEQLLSMIKQAGLGLFGKEETTDFAAGSDAEAEKHGDIDVVGDHDGMMALIKKVTGAGPESSDYADEEEHDHGHEEPCNVCGEASCKCEDSHEMVDEVESYDQEEEEVAEDNLPDSDAAETTADENAEAAEDEALAQADEEQVNEFANDAGENAKDFDDESFKTDIDFMTKVISGGLNKQKSTGQTTIPVIAGQNDRMGYSATNESIKDWIKLAGLK